jgi:hypothetical protein
MNYLWVALPYNSMNEDQVKNSAVNFLENLAKLQPG